MTRTVAHLVDTEEFGGAERALLHLVTNHDQERWRPVLLHPGEPGLAPRLDGARAAGVELREVPAMRRFRGAVRLPTFLGALDAVQPDVFHAHLNWPLACSTALLGAALRRVPARIATVQLFGRLPRAITLGLQRRVVVATVGCYLAVSEGVAARLRDTLDVPPHRVRVVPNAVPGDRTPPGAGEGARRALGVRPGQPLIVTMARLTEQKGLGYLLEAAAMLADVVFAIAGEGPDRGALEARIAQLELGDRVRLLGFRTDTTALLAASDLYVLPSLYEGLPLSILEAMALGKAVVASDIPGNDEAVVQGETGLLVPPGDSGALAEAIRALLADPMYAARLGTAGAQRVRDRFSARAMAAAVEATYDDVLAERALRRGR
jgi:glycosyltransferase involved in cell wall biosynthesis